MLTKVEKGKIVEELKEKIAKQRVAIFSNFHGLSVTKQQELRRSLKKENAEYKVAKKTLISRAFESAKIPFVHKDFKGELSVIFGYGDEASPAKSLFKFGRKNPDAISIVGGILGSRALSKDEVVSLAKLPSREELLGQVARAISAPIRGFLNVLNGNQRKLVLALSEIARKKS
ncbi:MAG: 50S ribosomal protein L10 [Candidatus Sungbacteria bacterium]|uniref:Large ribosomal subunit protein uL10 n=1 Tax=Candidatus Sungiibacteriota bacterium TaxID=2750080 RepID=A0A9D6QYM4_9BACT|nr:50S ribosomal protein L10 [Candidatus Sungbacteria bacterium]